MSSSKTYAGGITPDFLTEVKKGNVVGHEIIGIVARNPFVGTSFVDLWGANVTHIKPVSEETWEVVSTSVNDTAAGTGARTVSIEYLDGDYNTQTVIKELNGTTPVTLNSDHLRMQFGFVVTVGSSSFNEGTITIKSAGTGNAQGEIPFSDVGFCVTQDGNYTIPAGKFGFGLQIVPFFPKNEDGILRSILQTEQGPKFIGAELPFYQTGQPIALDAPFALPEKTDIQFQGKSSNVDVMVVATAALLIVDNNFIGNNGAVMALEVI